MGKFAAYDNECDYRMCSFGKYEDGLSDLETQCLQIVAVNHNLEDSLPGIRSSFLHYLISCVYFVNVLVYFCSSGSVIETICGDPLCKQRTSPPLYQLT